MYGCSANTRFAIRALMKSNPATFNLCILFFSIVFFAQAVRIAEAPLIRITPDMDYFDFLNSVWAVVLTMTTVGYGDIFPRTGVGRVIMFFCSVTGVVVIALIVTTVQSELQMENSESRAFTVINKISAMAEVKNEAAGVIGKASQIFLKFKKKNKVRAEELYQLSNKVSSFKKKRR